MESKNDFGYGIGYQAMVQLINEAEKATKPSPQQPIDIKRIMDLEQQAAKAKVTYIDMLQMLESIISNKQRGTVKEGGGIVQLPEQGAIASGAVQDQLSNAAIEYIGNAQQTKSGYNPEEILKQMPAPKFKYMSAKKVDVDMMVLPSLSMSDQIAELERIMEGIKEGIFDAEHFEIVMEEVYALVKSVNERKKRLKKSGAKLSAIEQSLWLVRDKRLEEVIKAINEMNS
ncbi:MAG: hypothetical protein QXN59_01180 [Candidatus Micrarchaeaceae archaeon]